MSDNHHLFKKIKLSTDQQNLVADAWKLIWKFSNQCTPKSLRHYNWAIEESYDIAVRSACLAATTFDKSLGREFGTYAFKFVRIAIAQHWKVRGIQLAKSVSISDHEDDGKSLGSILECRRTPEPSTTVEHVEYANWLLDCNLSDQERLVVNQLFGLGCDEKPANRIALEQGYCKSMISKIKKDAFKKIKSKVKKYNHLN